MKRHSPFFAFASVAALYAATGAAAEIADPLRAADEALSLIEAEDWPAAAAAYGRLVDYNPYQGAYWYGLGLSRARLDDCDSAAPALDRAIALGVDGRDRPYAAARMEAAACASERGDVATALDHFLIAWGRLKFSDLERLEADDRYAALRAHPDYRRLTGGIDRDALSRDEGWRHDLRYLAELVEIRHPDPFHAQSEAAWRRAVDELDASIPRLTDLQITGALMRLMGRIGDGHTALYPPFGGPRAFHVIPIRPFAFGEEWRVIATTAEHRELLGAKIISVAGLPAAEAEDRLAAVFAADNERTRKLTASIGLQFVEYGAAALGSDDEEGLSFEFELIGGARRTRRFEGAPLDRNPVPRWAPPGWEVFGAPTPPLHLSRIEESYWFTDHAALDAVYAQVNLIGRLDPSTGMSFPEFAESLGRRLRDGGAKRLILDIRHNNGGNGFENWDLVRQIVLSEAVDREGGLFVITGRGTFSAATTLTSMLETRTNAIFVGEPGSSRPNFYGEDNQFLLPYSGLAGSISSHWFQGGRMSTDARPWTAPDLIAEPTLEHVIEGRDPALEAIAAYLKAQEGD